MRKALTLFAVLCAISARCYGVEIINMSPDLTTEVQELSNTTSTATNDIVDLKAATNVLDTSVTALNSATTALDTAVGAIETNYMKLDGTTAMGADLNLGGNAATNGSQVVTTNGNHTITIGDGLNQRFVADGVASGQIEEMDNFRVDHGTASGGEVHVMDVQSIGSGLDRVSALSGGDGVTMIHQHIGTPITPNGAFSVIGNSTNDVTNALGSAATDVTLFQNDNDYLYLGAVTNFDSVEVVLATNANLSIFQNAGSIVFEYLTNATDWVSFSPDDGTDGFQQNGNIQIPDTLAGWSAQDFNNQTNFWIRIQRTRNTLSTPPTEDTIKTEVGTTYEWDASGNINALKVTAPTIVIGTNVVDATAWNGRQRTTIPVTVTAIASNASTVTSNSIDLSWGNAKQAYLINYYDDDPAHFVYSGMPSGNNLGDMWVWVNFSNSVAVSFTNDSNLFWVDENNNVTNIPPSALGTEAAFLFRRFVDKTFIWTSPTNEMINVF